MDDEVFKLPDAATLKKYVDEARIKTLMQLLDRCKMGDASAAELQALLKAAKEVEAMIPDHVLNEAAEAAHECLTAEEEELPFAPGSDYDPEAPLGSFH